MSADLTCPCGTALVREGVVVCSHWTGSVCQDCEAAMFVKHNARLTAAMDAAAHDVDPSRSTPAVAVLAPRVAPAGERETATSEREAIELANAALVTLATHYAVTPATEKVSAAIRRLEALARLAPQKPSDADVRWGIRNDPLTHAAYTIGRLSAPSAPSVALREAQIGRALLAALAALPETEEFCIEKFDGRWIAYPTRHNGATCHASPEGNALTDLLSRASLSGDAPGQQQQYQG